MSSVDLKPARCAVTGPASPRAVLSSCASAAAGDDVAAIITVVKKIAPIKPTTRAGAHDRRVVQLLRSCRGTSAVLLTSELDSNAALLASPAARNSASVLGAEAADCGVAPRGSTASHAMQPAAVRRVDASPPVRFANGARPREWVGVGRKESAM